VNDSQEWSTTRTFANEDRLPRVPLPTLERSCARFLEWCAPLLTEAELTTTRAAVDEFLKPDGPARVLHADLERFNAGRDVRSWLDEFWPNRYLGRRDRIALNANFFFLFRDSDESQIERAAGLIAAALDHKVAVDAEALPPVLQRGAPQTMAQNKFLYSTTRIPGARQDTVRGPYSPEWPGPSRSRHIVVFHRGNALRMDVRTEDGRPHDLDDLAGGLREVLKAGQARADISAGHLTTKARAEWAASRERLLADPTNAAALDTIETALFCLALEDFAPESTLDICDALLYGSPENRWFDKAVSLIVFADGRAGINIEHCGLDGTTILQFVDFLHGSTAREHADRAGAVSAGSPAVSPVEFVLDEQQRAEVRAAAESFATFAHNTASTVLSFADFGANRAKELGMSPDAFVQMAYQLAHQRAKGRIGATYESIATRQFQGGRTEAMRVVTPEVLRFVEAMEDPAADRETRAAAFRAAAAKHVARAKECQAGDAPEQHLWELLMIQQRRGAELGVTEPIALYDTPGWRIMRADYLSTSSAPSTTIRFFGFGSTSSQCIGVAYVLLPEEFNIYLSTPRPVAAEMVTFAEKLAEAITQLQELLAT
jgi:carnitine O-acetyltransferase